MLIYLLIILKNERKLLYIRELYMLSCMEAVMLDLPIFMYFWAILVFSLIGG